MIHDTHSSSSEVKYVHKGRGCENTPHNDAAIPFANKGKHFKIISSI
jgi:hypothetical protein